MNVMFIDPGRMHHDLLLEEMQPESDGLGGYSENWIEIRRLWVNIEPISATSRFYAEKHHQEITHRFMMRYTPEPKQGMRFRKAQRCFIILNSYDPDETKRYTTCLVREVVS